MADLVAIIAAKDAELTKAREAIDRIVAAVADEHWYTKTDALIRLAKAIYEYVYEEPQ